MRRYLIMAAVIILLQLEACGIKFVGSDNGEAYKRHIEQLTKWAEENGMMVDKYGRLVKDDNEK